MARELGRASSCRSLSVVFIIEQREPLKGLNTGRAKSGLHCEEHPLTTEWRLN
jgi:hypothetical protein